MASDDYRLQNIYRYARKTYKNDRRRINETDTNNSLIDTHVNEPNLSPRSDGVADYAGCTCDLDPERDIASILHKKCPVITLAQQQLQRLLDETDKLLYENMRGCRTRKLEYNSIRITNLATGKPSRALVTVRENFVSCTERQLKATLHARQATSTLKLKIHREIPRIGLFQQLHLRTSPFTRLSVFTNLGYIVT